MYLLVAMSSSNEKIQNSSNLFYDKKDLKLFWCENSDLLKMRVSQFN